MQTLIGRSWNLWLLVAFMLLPAPSYGQSGKDRQSQPTDPAAPANGTLDLSSVKERIVAATNRFRNGEGRQELKVNPELSKAAQAFAEFMAHTDKYSHTADAKQPWERAAEAGYEYCIVAENIAY